MQSELHPKRAFGSPHQVSGTTDIRPARIVPLLTWSHSQETHRGAPVPMSLFPTILATRQPEAARPDRTRQRGHPDRLARCDWHTIPEADKDRQGATGWWPGQGIDGRQRWPRPWTFQVSFDVEHRIRQLHRLRVWCQQRGSPATTAARHGSRSSGATFSRVIPWSRWPVLPPAIA